MAQLLLLTPSPHPFNQVRSWRSRSARNWPSWTSSIQKSPVRPVWPYKTDPPFIHPSPSKTPHTSTLKNNKQRVNTSPAPFTTSLPSYLPLFPQLIIIPNLQLRRVVPRIKLETSTTPTNPPARSSWISFRIFRKRSKRTNHRWKYMVAILNGTRHRENNHVVMK